MFQNDVKWIITAFFYLVHITFTINVKYNKYLLRKERKKRKAEFKGGRTQEVETKGEKQENKFLTKTLKIVVAFTDISISLYFY